MSQKFISLIGAGRWGKNLLRDLHQLGVLHSVCEPNLDLVAIRKLEYPDLLFVNSLDDLVNYPEISAVMIAVPEPLHFSLAFKAIGLGYHTFVEKPLTLKYAEGLDLIRYATEKGRILMVGHLLQYHPAILKIKELIQDDMIGKIQYIKSNRLNLGQVRKGANVLWSLAPHDISIILSLMNHRLPEKIICSGFSTLNPPICDATTTLLHFGDQYAEICVNWLFPYKEQSLIIVGEKGMITFKDSVNPELLYYRQPVTFEDGEVVLHRNEPVVIEFDHSVSPLVLECQHFIDCCLGKIPRPRTDGHEANRVTAVLELAQKSLDAGGSPQYISSLVRENLKWSAHSSAIISNGAKIGDGTKIWHHSHIMDAQIGKDCNIGQGVFIGKGVVIGNNCKIQNNVNVYAGVVCEDGVFLGPNCTTTNDKNPRAEYSKDGNYLKTLIKRGASVGAGAVICPGITLGEYCLVGAGAVVTKDILANQIVVGNPARVISFISNEGVISTSEI